MREDRETMMSRCLRCAGEDTSRYPGCHRRMRRMSMTMGITICMGVRMGMKI